jgi:adenosylcobinamide-GDP ribazoletransferase|uniref:Adenosylcobinamide-GDP ribazoletransferase n=1 Tax=Desulfobacca acetoxidans TaxID=60893 RepID=A0A7C5ALF0_9BACT
MKCTFPLALTFLTVIPWPRLGEVTPQDLARSLFWFPWVGLILGLLYFGLGLIILEVFAPPAGAGLLLTLTVVLTRGLHLDGLADTLDGLGGGRTREARLAIMKDSRLGAFGALGLILVLLLKYTFLVALLEQGLWRGLVTVPVVSRWGLVLLASLSPYARREGGLGQAMTEGATFPRTAGTTACTLVLVLVLGGGGAAAAVIFLSALAVWGLGHGFQKALGGVTGDVFGATHEVLELLGLACILIFPEFWKGIPFSRYF